MNLPYFIVGIEGYGLHSTMEHTSLLEIENCTPHI